MFGVSIAGLLALLAAVEGSVIVYSLDTPHTIMGEFRDMPADFGADFPLEGLRGLLVVADPPDACTNVTKPPTTDNFTGRWIVLIAKSNCTFELQVRNAQAAGFDCAIVHNVNSSELEIMTAADPDGIDIPSVFVDSYSGFKLAQDYIYTMNVYLMVNSDLPFDFNTHLLLPFAIIVVLCLLIIIIVMIVKCIKDRRRERRRRLPRGALRRVLTCKFSKGDPYDTCAICLDDYVVGDRLRVLPCAHAYHRACIDPWLTQSRRVCPVCKRRVQVAGERAPPPDSDSDDEPTAPLLRDPPGTQGGTFDEQRENPFARAMRFMVRLRARANLETSSISSDSNDPGNYYTPTNSTDASGEHAASPPAVVSEVSERPQHSINTNDDPGEIGVAALPAPQSGRLIDL